MTRRDEIRKALLAKFLSKAAERIGVLVDAMARFEEAPLTPDGIDAGAVDSAMREIHTLKGESRLMGFDVASQLCHTIEDLMAHARRLDFRVDASVYRLAVQGLDLVADLVQEAAPEPEPNAAVKEFGTRAAQLLGRPAEPTATATPREPSPSQPGRISSHELDRAARPAASARSSGPPSSGRRSPPGRRREPTRPTPGASGHPATTGHAASPAIARVPVERLEMLSHLATDLLLLQHRQEHTLRTVVQLRAELGNLELVRGAQGTGGTGIESTPVASMRQRLAGLLAGWGETLFEARTHLRTLNDHIHQLRLVPLSNLLDRYPPAIRAMARAQSKDVKVTVDGGHIAVDQQLVDEIADPLVHIVRNAVDHGIGTPGERRAAGKSERGSITLRARESGGVVRLEVRDDGRGVDPARVAAAALARGLCTPDEARNLDMRGALRLIMRPGFTTSAMVTDVSGRGVGMDAVVAMAERLGGSVQMESELGKGTLLELSVPAQVALVEVLVVDAGNAWYAIPALAVHRVVYADPSQLVRAATSWVLKDEGLLVPVVSLSDLVASSAPGPAASERAAVIVLSHGDKLLGLRAHALVGNRTAIRRQLDPFVAALHLINGTSVLETGELVYLVNVPEIFRLGRETEPVAQRAAPSDEARAARVLVVDDSELTRDMLVVLTRNLGLEVIEAVNGRDALDRLGRERVDLILTDLDMPVMDGITLIERLRAQESTRDMPIVVLSTRGTVEDKERAMRAGADSYLVKSQFDEAEFAAMVGVYVSR